MTNGETLESLRIAFQDGRGEVSAVLELNAIYSLGIIHNPALY